METKMFQINTCMGNNSDDDNLSQQQQLDLDEEQEIMAKFRWFRVWLKFSGLVFWDEKNRVLRILKIVLATILIALAIYQAIFSLILLFGQFQFLSSARSIISISWIIQSIISVGFIFHFQFKSWRLCKILHVHDGSKRTEIVIKRTLITIFSLFFLTYIMGNYLGRTETETNPIVNNQIDQVKFQTFASSRAIFLLRIGIIAWLYVIVMVGIAFYTTALNVLQNQLAHFNGDKLAKIGENDGDIAQQMEEYFGQLVDMTSRVRQVDRIFQVYVCVMVACSLPTATFSLISVSLSFQNNSWLSVAQNFPDLILLIVLLICLITPAAAIHSRIIEVESLIHSNMHIWKSPEKQVQKMAHNFIAHVKQPNLGITLWGFTVVTNSLILTVLSMTVTYFTFIIQMRTPAENNKNGTR